MNLYVCVLTFVWLLSHVQLFGTPGTAALQVSLSFTISQSLLKLMSIESMMPFNHLILCRRFSSCPQSFPASGSFPVSQLFVSGGQSTGTSAWASVLPMDIQGSIQGWFPLGFGGLILQSKGQSSLPQNCSSKTSILQCSAFFMVQISHPCMTIQTFVGKVMSAF